MTSRIIVALDGMTEEKALGLVSLLHPYVWGFKVNDLLIDKGTEIITTIKMRGAKSVFADPKIHDIPNTHKNTVAKLVRAGADLITVHASAGMDALRASVDAVKEQDGSCKILCMMVPTSMTSEECHFVYGTNVSTTMLRFARCGKLAGVGGYICGPTDLPFLCKHWEFENGLWVVPGIRDTNSPSDDQQRKATAAEAITLGADLLVIGRLITNHENPDEKVHQLNEEISEELKKKSN